MNILKLSRILNVDILLLEKENKEMGLCQFTFKNFHA